MHAVPTARHGRALCYLNDGLNLDRNTAHRINPFANHSNVSPS